MPMLSQPQMTPELVQNVTGPEQKTQRGHFDMCQVGLTVAEEIRMTTDVPDPLRPVLGRRRAIQKNGTTDHGLWAFLLSAPVVSSGVRFMWTSPSPLYLCASACTFASSTTLFS